MYRSLKNDRVLYEPLDGQPAPPSTFPWESGIPWTLRLQLPLSLQEGLAAPVEQRSKKVGVQGVGNQVAPPDLSTYLQAYGANYTHKASDAFISLLPEEAWGSRASLSPICSLG